MKYGSANLAKSVGVSILGASVLCLTTANLASAQPSPVDLGSAGSFAILSKTGITDVFHPLLLGMLERAPSPAQLSFSPAGKCRGKPTPSTRLVLCPAR